MTSGYMRQLGVTIDAQAIARGLLKMMDEAGDDEATLIRFGLLPARWMDMVQKQMDEVVRDRFQLLPYGSRDKEHTVIINPGNPDACHVETFRIRDVVSEMLHEVALALYDSVEMVV